ncbi:hypothetical protein NW752_000377 [Fusarium irregulare]|uniref:CCHC-type domain-containing protein n=1 Tax=Fusarium irregulare TaxID=2494466 RepID=A0A9W8PYP2_9HYPO|nr:hypothetical protein NW766_001453 [Fusarium irregulare]KAJ4028120.1 hypothetical protein NW752_000377 [Fusarium irregulare]
MSDQDTAMGNNAPIDHAFAAFLASKEATLQNQESTLPAKRSAPDIAQTRETVQPKKPHTGCYACGQPGHVKANCPRVKAEQQATQAEGAQ